MNQDLLELALLDELKTMNRMKRLESDLIDQFDFAFNWVMDAIQKNHLELPNKEGIFSCLQRIDKLMEEIYGKTPDSEHGFGNTQKPNKTENFFLMNQ
jgi:hypothetical protein